MNNKWGVAETRFIKDHATTMSDTELTKSINYIFKKNVSKAAVRKKRQRLKIKKKPGSGVCEIDGKDKEATVRD